VDGLDRGPGDEVFVARAVAEAGAVVPDGDGAGAGALAAGGFDPVGDLGVGLADFDQAAEVVGGRRVGVGTGVLLGTRWLSPVF
jgi:hypothetical protein